MPNVSIMRPASSVYCVEAPKIAFCPSQCSSSQGIQTTTESQQRVAQSLGFGPSRPVWRCPALDVKLFRGGALLRAVGLTQGPRSQVGAWPPAPGRGTAARQRGRDTRATRGRHRPAGRARPRLTAPPISLRPPHAGRRGAASGRALNAERGRRVLHPSRLCTRRGIPATRSSLLLWKCEGGDRGFKPAGKGGRFVPCSARPRV